MKKYCIALLLIVLTLSLCACSFGGKKDQPEKQTTVPSTTQEATTMPTLPPVAPNVPETTEGRGSTDDTKDSPNETLPEDMQKIRRRIMD